MWNKVYYFFFIVVKFKAWIVSWMLGIVYQGLFVRTFQIMQNTMMSKKIFFTSPTLLLHYLYAALELHQNFLTQSSSTNARDAPWFDWQKDLHSPTYPLIMIIQFAVHCFYKMKSFLNYHYCNGAHAIASFLNKTWNSTLNWIKFPRFY